MTNKFNLCFQRKKQTNENALVHSTTLNWAVGKLAIIEWMIWFMLHSKFCPGLLTDSISIDIDPSFRLFRAFMTPATCAAEIGLLLEHAATEISRDSLGLQHCSISLQTGHFVISSTDSGPRGVLQRAGARGENRDMILTAYSWSLLKSQDCHSVTNSVRL